jgi:hypothetical protein
MQGMTNKKPPARLYFLLAREAPIGVIFRRGPTKWVQLIHWRTDTDTFTPGQWFHGRIYEKRCDVSPDGTKLVYFAQKLSSKSLEDAEGFAEELLQKPVPPVSNYYTYAWTAVSKPPYFTALALWPKGNSWAGGGLFETNDTLWLNHGPGMDRAHFDHLPKSLNVKPNSEAHGEDDPILHRRLLRDGWEQIQAWKGDFEKGSLWEYFEGFFGKGIGNDQLLSELSAKELGGLTAGSGYATTVKGTWIRQNPEGCGKLWLYESLTGFEAMKEFAVSSNDDAHPLPLPDAQWAEWDHTGRLVYACAGKIFAASVHAEKLDSRELADLNPNSPEEIITPDPFRSW